MKNTRLLIIILTSLIFISCFKGVVYHNNIIINSEKSEKWNLPELNLIARIPKKYNLSYNESNGFYLQARKFDKNRKLLAEISIGKIEGELKESQVLETLNKAERELANKLENNKQIKYETTFIGEELILGKKTKNLKGIIEFDRFQTNIDGKFYLFMTPIILDNKNKFMLSSMFLENENLDKNKIGLDLLDFMMSMRIAE